MRIVKIDIDNFGTLSDFHINMEQNPVIIIKDNGWGKSTLASFIRVMFYGFADETKKSASDRERNRLRPWNHGIYGGTIIYEYDGRQFRLQRTFGAKSSEDTCSLIDTATKLPCNEYDTDNLGNQLMGVDCEAYVRTMHIGQNKLSVRNDKGNLEDGITAKIGNLTEATDDINNFDSVMERLKKESNSLKSGYKKGAINELRAKRDYLVAGQNSYNTIIGDIERTDAYILELEEKLEACAVAIKKVDAEYSFVGKYQLQKNNEEKRQELLEDIRHCKENINSIRETLKYRVPAPEEVQAMTGVINQANSLREQCNSMLLVSQAEKTEDKEAAGPDADELGKVLNVIRKRKECRTRLDETKAQYDRDLDLLKFKKESASREIERKRDAAEERYLSSVEKLESKEKLCKGMVIVIALALLSVLVVMYISTNNTIFAVLSAATIPVGGLLLLVICNSYKGKKLEIEREDTGKEQDYSEDERKLAILLDALKHYEDSICHLEGQLRSFCEKYNIPDDELIEVKLFSMHERINNVKKNDYLDKYNTEQEKLKEITDKIETWFRGITDADVTEWLETVITYKQLVKNYNDSTEKLKELNDRLASMQTEDMSYEGEVRDVEEIIRERDELNLRMDELKANISRTKEEHKQLIRQKNLLEEEKQNLLSIDEKLEEYHHKYDIIIKTMDYLGRAKEKLSARYMDPIEDAFVKYYSYITTDYIDCYEIDADIKLTRQELGQRRDSESLSKGYKDLVDVSLRMALLDVMYEGEKPWVIMDDPFVNLDTSKLEQVKTFLEEIAKDYQVLYFTCHESRA